MSMAINLTSAFNQLKGVDDQISPIPRTGHLMGKEHPTDLVWKAQELYCVERPATPP